MAWVLLEAPDVRLLNGCLKTQMTRIELCERNSAYVHLPSIPDTLVNAILVSEDIGFFIIMVSIGMKSNKVFKNLSAVNLKEAVQPLASNW